MSDSREKPAYLEFSCQSIGLCVEPGDIVEETFTIYAAERYAEGKIYSSDTRMRLYETEFHGVQTQVTYCFDGTAAQAGSNIRGEFVLICNCGEYAIPYTVSVQRPQLQSSLGLVKNLFHFTNLAQTDWKEAVALFYSRNFASILHKSDKNVLLS